jgi:alpha-mannosidase
VPAGGARILTLPDNPKIRIFAVSAAAGLHDEVYAAWPLYDTLPRPDAAAAPTISPAHGTFDDAVTVSFGHTLFWNATQLHYTMDGRDPTSDSPTYSGPFDLENSATIKACYISKSGEMGPVALARLDVKDVTPPRVTSAVVVDGLPSVVISFSKPLRPQSIGGVKQFSFDPNLAVRSVTLGADGRSVELMLGQPVHVGGAMSLRVVGAQDRSPAGNQIKPTAVAVQTLAPIYTQPGDLTGQKEIKAAGLPTKAGDAWTLNMFCRPDHQIPSQTILAGFGRADDIRDGAGRYLANFSSGLHFWSRLQDVESTALIDPGRWQMLSATYDGHDLRLYKNGREVGQGQPVLADDDSTVRFAPTDPWTYKNVFAGQIRQLTIWNGSLSPAMVAALYQAKKDQP